MFSTSSNSDLAAADLNSPLSKVPLHSASRIFSCELTPPLLEGEDPTLHRQQRAGYYGFAEIGFGVLDNRRVILGSF